MSISCAVDPKINVEKKISFQFLNLTLVIFQQFLWWVVSFTFIKGEEEEERGRAEGESKEKQYQVSRRSKRITELVTK